MSSFRYAAPTSLEEAIALLSQNTGARVVAGGHRLLVEPERSRLAGGLVVDLRRIPGLAGIETQPDGRLKIGAMATLAAIASSGAVQNGWRALAEAAQGSEDAQIRNRATIGGSLAFGDPEADLPAAILALDAKVEKSGPVITGFLFPAAARRPGSAYEKMRHPATLRAICGVAASISLGENGAVSTAGVALTGAADRAARLAAVENALLNQQPRPELLAAAAAAAREQLTFRGDHFASADYRRHLAGVIAERALRRAVERAVAVGAKTHRAGGDQ
jgi:carbon-monoxide dehydrogenase medium subunit